MGCKRKSVVAHSKPEVQQNKVTGQQPFIEVYDRHNWKADMPLKESKDTERARRLQEMLGLHQKFKEYGY